MLFLSIGENCLFGSVFKRLHIQNTWSTPYTYARSNIIYALHNEKTDYRDLLDKEYIIKDEEYISHKYWRNKNFLAVENDLFDITVSSGFEFTHHDIINNIDNIRSYERKIKRMIDLRSNKEDVVFFYHHRYTKNYNVDMIVPYCSEFLDFYANNNRKSEIVIINQRIIGNYSERHIEISKRGNCIIVDFYTLSVWEGNGTGYVLAEIDDDLICEMFERLFALDVIDDISFLMNYYLSCNFYFNSGVDNIEINIHGSLPDNGEQSVYVWGYCNDGLALTDYLVKRGIIVNGLVDNDDSKHGPYNGIPVISPFDIYNDSVIILAEQNEEYIREIRNQIMILPQKCKIVQFSKKDLPHIRYYDYMGKP